MKPPSAKPPVTASTWQQLRAHTEARIALGRAGTSLPTAPHLDFQLDHARARDAVHRELDIEPLLTLLGERGQPCLRAHSNAADRHIYLQRPDQGRCLDIESRQRLAAHGEQVRDGYDAAFVIADGLSPRAVQDHALPFLEAMLPRLVEEGWRLAPLVLVEQGRVAIGDEIAELLRSRQVAILIGERPGLSSPDSMGIYLTYAPRVGSTDAQRNCISNIRPAGLSYAHAAHKLHYLMTEARRRRLTGVMLKDESEAVSRLDTASHENFLLG